MNNTKFSKRLLYFGLYHKLKLILYRNVNGLKFQNILLWMFHYIVLFFFVPSTDLYY